MKVNTFFIIAQILGALVFILNIIGHAKLTTKKVYLYNSICNALSIAQYSLLADIPLTVSSLATAKNWNADMMPESKKLLLFILREKTLRWSLLQHINPKVCRQTMYS